MFQTKIHIWLQQFDNEYIIQFFKLVTMLGYPEFFMASLIVIIFGIHFRKGFVLLLVVMWTSAFTLVLKDTFDLPRPYMVENEVKILDEAVNTDIDLLDDASAAHFFEFLPQSTIDYFDNQPISYGLPSGHTSIAVAFWGSLMLLFRKRWLTILSVSLIFLIPFSRIYLGVHFIADILSGYIVGLLMLWFFYRLVIRPQALMKYLKINKHEFTFDIKNFLILVAPLLWLAVLEETKYWIIPGVLLGFGAGLILLSQKGLPDETGSVLYRIGKVVSALVVFVCLDILSEFLAVKTSSDFVIHFLRYVLISFVVIWLITLYHIRLGWATRSKIDFSDIKS